MARELRNILFIMFDQLRWDYLSCAGHPHLKTPSIDRLASKGVRFDRAYVQSPVCGPSRMSFYTGRYAQSHGAQWNKYPLNAGELTLGDHLRETGMDAYLIGKTHMQADLKGMRRMGLEKTSVEGGRIAECGFDVVVRDDGLWPEGIDGAYDDRQSPYNEYLKAKGYDSENPWSTHANSVDLGNGETASGWLMEYLDHPANVAEVDSETHWLTTQAIDFMQQPGRDDAPWLCHLSYIKPHWPYVAPAPYHSLYSSEHLLPVVRSALEQDLANPVYQAYMRSTVARTFSRLETREKVIPAYMGLIKQCDDQIGRLFEYLEQSGRMDDTMIAITSDHGDYLGDHWLGEKNFFHECAVRVPMIVFDPRAEADAARGTVCDALVESIDLTATFVDAAGQRSFPDHVLEGRSLMPWLQGKPPTEWRKYAISEVDYVTSPMFKDLDVSSRDARLFMVFDGRWKLIHAEGGFQPMLFDLETDPDEFKDLGVDPKFESERTRLYAELASWSRRMSQRTTVSEAYLENLKGRGPRRGILVGMYDGSEFPETLLSKLPG